MKSLNFANCCNEKNLAFYMRYHFFRNFDDYPGFKLKITPPKHFSWQCSLIWCFSTSPFRNLQLRVEFLKNSERNLVFRQLNSAIIRFTRCKGISTIRYFIRHQKLAILAKDVPSFLNSVYF